MKKIKLLITVIAVIALLSLTAAAYKHQKSMALKGPDAPEATSLEEVNSLQKTSSLPTSLNIEVPFYTQAPHANWDYPWQEACEEASVLLVANVFNKMNLNVDAYNTELLRLVSWETGYFGSYEHTDVSQTAEMIEINYDLETRIHENPTFEDIQKILNEGHLIVAPFAGKLMFNPNFRNGGPNYHMIVIKGYNAETMQLVTHDVGTRNGENYVYDWSVLENALHDWHDDDITLGEKKLIEIFPPSE
jgi:hypothetical protein